MKNFLILLAFILIATSCGKFKVEAKDSKHKLKVDAETYSYVIIRLEFIKEIQDLCEDLYPEYETPVVAERAKLVSKCTLDKMSLVDFKAISDFKKGVCDAPVTPQEFEICKLISNGTN